MDKENTYLNQTNYNINLICSRQNLHNAFVKYISAEAIYISLLLGAVSLMCGAEISTFISFVYILLCVMLRKDSIIKLCNFVVFLSITYFAVYMYNTELIEKWFYFSILPILSIVILLKFQQLSLYKIGPFSSKIRGQLRVNCIISSILVADVIAIICRDKFYIYGGVLLLLLLQTFVSKGSYIKITVASLIITTIYTSLIVLFAWRGILFFPTKPLIFLNSYWYAISVPYIITITGLIKIKNQKIERGSQE